MSILYRVVHVVITHTEPRWVVPLILCIGIYAGLLLTQGAVRLSRESAPTNVYDLGSLIEFCLNCNGSAHVARGWSAAESWGTWTCGNRADLSFNLPKPLPEELELIARLNAITDGKRPQEVIVLINGQTKATWHIESHEEIKRLVFSRALASKKEPLEISFLINRPLRPSSLGTSFDNRLLGVGLREIRIATH